MNDMKEIIEEIKARCDIASVIGDYIKIQPSGQNYKALCPFHVEKTPSFHISTAKQVYKCFGCGEGGDVINFVMKMENLDFMDAVRLLANRCGIDINFNIDEETKQKIELSKKYQDIHTEAARFYFANLVKSKNRGYDYLRNRGLDDKTIKRFGLGYSQDAWSSLMDYLIDEKGYSVEELLECGLIGKSTKTDKYYDKFRNRVMFPIFDYRGNVIGFGGRVLDDSLPKYLNSPDTLIFNKRHNLYGLNFARKNLSSRTVILVEGYMDLISLYQYGIKIAVATLGTALTSQQARLIKRYADNVIISYDSDGPGTKASLRAIDILVEAGLSVKVLDLKDAKDPDEYVRKYGTDEYRNAMKDAVPRIKFKIDNLKSTFDLSKDQDNIKFAQEAVNIIKQLKSPVEIDYYIKYLSEIVQLDEDAVKREIYGKSYSSKNLSNGKFNNKFNKKEEKPIEKMDAIQHGEELTEIKLMKIMMNIPAAREKVLLKIDEKELLMEDSKKILNYLSKIDSEKIVEPDELEGINDEYIKSLKKTSLESINTKNMKEIEETVRSVRRNSLKKTIDKLRMKQEELGAKSKILAESDKEAAKELDLEIMNLALQSVDLNKRLRNL
ncbi:DNA primase [Peptacetobacter hiranonis]|uniref:DNA primase n=1 Tax=Peptacetobacter hiranonis TaxID=89152 RepID=UPI001917780B|nr:DNA primase [Peptacetobacter hiranonis]QQQ87326.1 DNA primase [Peptacetobacter hiranonis]